MKKLKKVLAVLLAAIMLFALTACSEKGGIKGEGLSTYTIDMVLNDDLKTVDVTQKVEYVNNYEVELSDLYFHLYPNAFREGARFIPYESGQESKMFPNGKSYGKIEMKTLKVSGKDTTIKIEGQDEDILVVDFDTKLMPSQKITIDMTYTLTVPNVSHRYGYVDSTINLGNFYPIACVYENGEFESSPYYSNGDPFYSEVANYKVSITAPKKYSVAMSGVTATTELGDTNRSFATTTSMRDFAVVLGEFQRQTATVEGVGITYYYYDDDDAAASIQVSADSLKTFNSLFGKYPYLSLAVVQTSFLHGGMEYPGLVYISDKVEGEMYRDTIIHEVAHQWWYAIVGNNQIENSWLDESLAEYSATLFYENNKSYNITYSKRVADALGGYVMYCDLFPINLNTSMNRRLPDYRTSLEYTYMTYTKGQIMMDSLRKTIGDKAFFEAFKAYFADNYLKISKPDNLISAFEKASNKELKSFFSTWVEGKVVMYGT